MLLEREGGKEGRRVKVRGEKEREGGEARARAGRRDERLDSHIYTVQINCTSVRRGR